MQHPLLAGYREVLGAAQAYGAPVTHVPDWLVGRETNGAGRGLTPIPVYENAETGNPVAPESFVTPEAPATPDPVAPALSVPVPPKPPAVTEYEARVNEGGWHDEVGCLLLVAGVGGVIFAVWEEAPLLYASAVLIVLGVSTWLAGSRQGREKQARREKALEYVRALTAAQTAGAQVPELSYELQKLLAEDREAPSQ